MSLRVLFLLFVSCVVAACGDDPAPRCEDCVSAPDMAPDSSPDPDLAPDPAPDAAPDIAPSVGCLTVEGDLDFGAVAVGREAAREVVITNCATQELARLWRLSLDGGPFLMDPETTPEILSVDSPRGWQLAPGASLRLKVLAAPERVGAAAGPLTITHNVDAPPIQIAAALTATPRSCPAAVITSSASYDEGRRLYLVQTRGAFELSGARSIPLDGAQPPLRHTWRVAAQPAGASFAFEAPGAAVQRAVTLETPGRYTFELTVAQGDVQGCADARVEVVALAGQPPQRDALEVQLSWERPLGGAADLDLYYRHPRAMSWRAAPWSVYSQNREGDWGVLGNPEDNPSLDNDDVEGGVGEAIGHDNPEAGLAYAVGVHHLRATDAGAVDARVELYSRGELLHTERLTLAEGEFMLLGYMVMERGGRVRFDRRAVVTQGIPTL